MKSRFLYPRSSMTRVLVIGLMLLAMFFILGISCQAPAPTPSPTPEPTPELTPTPTPTPIAIEISGFKFVPATITVPAGTEVTWTNQDSASHTITSDTDLFESGSLGSNSSFSYTFGQSGTYSYFCRFHPYMKGEVIVE